MVTKGGEHARKSANCLGTSGAVALNVGTLHKCSRATRTVSDYNSACRTGCDRTPNPRAYRPMASSYVLDLTILHAGILCSALGITGNVVSLV